MSRNKRVKGITVESLITIRAANNVDMRYGLIWLQVASDHRHAVMYRRVVIDNYHGALQLCVTHSLNMLCSN